MNFLKKFAPIMNSYCYLEAPVDRVVEAFIEWRNSINQYHDISENPMLKRGNGQFSEAVLSLFPLNSYIDRFLFIPTKSSWTLYLNNSYRGSDRVGISPLMRKLGCFGIFVFSKMHNREGKGKEWRGSSGARILEFYESEHGEATKCRRNIWLVNDIGRWSFKLEGEPFPFEDLKAYKKGRKKDRFTFEMMEKYLGEFGIRPFDEAFYDSSNSALVVLERLTKGGGTLSFSTFDEVRKHLRIDHLYKDSD